MLVPARQKGNGLIFPSSVVGGSGGVQAPALRQAVFGRGPAGREAGRSERRQRERTRQRLRETRREISSLVDSLKPRNRIGRRGGRDGWQSTALLFPCPVLSRGSMKRRGSVIGPLTGCSISLHRSVPITASGLQGEEPLGE